MEPTSEPRSKRYRRDKSSQSELLKSIERQARELAEDEISKNSQYCEKSCKDSTRLNRRSARVSELKNRNYIDLLEKNIDYLKQQDVQNSKIMYDLQYALQKAVGQSESLEKENTQLENQRTAVTQTITNRESQYKDEIRRRDEDIRKKDETIQQLLRYKEAPILSMLEESQEEVPNVFGLESSENAHLSYRIIDNYPSNTSIQSTDISSITNSNSCNPSDITDEGNTQNNTLKRIRIEIAYSPKPVSCQVPSGQPRKHPLPPLDGNFSLPKNANNEN